jgi:outer membrane protein assembly factor BamA
MFSNNLILGGRFGFTYSDKAKNKGNHHVFLRWDVLELSGNTATALNKLLDRPFNETNTYNIFGVNYSQFAKTALDFRYNTKHDENNATVFRLFAGVGIPYGNSPKFLPFERRFWVGGANSLRAWLPRSLGPGGYYEFGQIDYSGDVKLEFNAEFRFNMYNRWLEGAVFVDAGNVWMAKKDDERPLANFEFNRFANELGIGTGFGTRLNFDIILIRLDFAIPLHDPSYNVGSRWVITNFDQDWLFNNINFNFGIGYPF